MFEYDDNKQVLTISKIPVIKKGHKYQPSEMYLSYMKYITEGAVDDVKNILIKELNAELGGSYNKVDLLDIKVEEDIYSSYHKYKKYSVFCKCRFGTLAVNNDEVRPFSIMKLPWMDEDGALSKDGKKYAMISELVQDDYITFNGQKVKVVTETGRVVNMEFDGSKVKFVTPHRNKVNALTVMHALAKVEGLDSLELFNKLASVELFNSYPGKTKLERDTKLRKDIVFGVNEDRISEFVSILSGRDVRPELQEDDTLEKKVYLDNYNLKEVRNRINEVCSLDRAIGYQLAVNIKISDSVEYQCDTVVDESMLRSLRLSKINELKVKEIPNMIGYYLAEDIPLYTIRRGTPINRALVEAMHMYKADWGDEIEKALTGNNLVEQINLPVGDCIVLESGTMIDDLLLEIINYNGYLEVELSQKIGGVSRNVPLYITVVGNRTIMVRDAAINSAKIKELELALDDYVYIDKDGNYVKCSEHLTAYDVLSLISLIDRVVQGKDESSIVSLDAGLRKRVNLAYESFHDAFIKAVPRFLKTRGGAVSKLKAKLNNYDGAFLSNSGELEALFFSFSKMWWKILYTEKKVIQQLDMVNPVAYYSSLDKINTILASKKAISESQHLLAMGHYGRICPYETPSGKTMGIVGNKAVECRIVGNKMVTPYHPVTDNGAGLFINFSKKVYLTVEEEEKKRIADITTVKFDKTTGRVLNVQDRVPARIPTSVGNERMTLADIEVSSIEFVNVNPSQTCACPATTIPFVESNDSARVVFGVGMVKQSKSLMESEEPIVTTSGYTDVLKRSPVFMVHAEENGVVEDVDIASVTIMYEKLGLKTYTFDPKEVSTNSIIIRYVEVERNQEVKAGEVLVSSNYISNGSLSMGVNCLVGYISTGNNYEDGINVSDRLKCRLRSFSPVREIRPIAKKLKDAFLKPERNFSYLGPNDDLFKLQYGDKEIKFKPEKKSKGFIIKRAMERDPNDGQKNVVAIETLSFSYAVKGDKLANRHGNKGVMPEPTPNNEMPQFENGEIIDICFSPAGVSSRMNIGQLKEANLGFVGMLTGTRMNSDTFNGASRGEIKMLLKFVHRLANEDDYERVLAEHADILPSGYINKCREQISFIQNWRGCFEEDGTAYLYNPRTGKKFETRAMIGVCYMHKLYHEVAKKEHARAGYLTEPYVEKLDAPPKGASKKGGQGYGHMELNALAAHGASNFMTELLNERGDNNVKRTNMTLSAVHEGNSYHLAESTAIRRSTEIFVNTAESLGVQIDFEGKLPNNTKQEASKRQAYKVKTLITANDTKGLNRDVVNVDKMVELIKGI